MREGSSKHGKPQEQTHEMLEDAAGSPRYGMGIKQRAQQNRVRRFVGYLPKPNTAQMEI